MKPKLLHLLFIHILSFACLSLQAQKDWHFDAAVTGGSTGVGLELAVPYKDIVTVRVGASYFPQFHKVIHCTAQVGEDETPTYDADGNREPSRFERMSEMLEGFVGSKVDSRVAMEITPKMNTLRLLVDVTPFANKNWHLTGGFFYGKSLIGTAVNKMSEYPTLMAINLYNRLVDNGGEIYQGFSLPPEILRKMMTYGYAGIPVGQYTHDIWDTDEDTGEAYVLHAKGDTYMMVPNNENSVFDNAKVNCFRPYFGAGYMTHLDKNRRWSFGVDAGVMFWGGAPKLIDHHGTDLMYDVENIGGNVGDYVELVRKAKALPVLEMKLSYRFF